MTTVQLSSRRIQSINIESGLLWVGMVVDKLSLTWPQLLLLLLLWVLLLRQ